MSSLVALSTRIARTRSLLPASVTRNGRGLTSRGKTASQGDHSTSKLDKNTGEAVAGREPEPGNEDVDDVEAPELVDMWNNEAPSGPEWNGPRGYEPTRHGDWSQKGRVSDF